jgi:hypothetical protein
MSRDVRNPRGDDTPTEGTAADDGPHLHLKYHLDQVLADFPNDLSKLIYLASIRDYNSGLYLHVELSRRYGVTEVDRLLRAHHERIFSDIVATPVSAYVQQLRLYISFARASRAELVRTWKDLKAYNSAIPLHCDDLAAQIFSSNVMAALDVLEQG